MNRDFIKSEERRKENGVQPMVLPWPYWLCGVGGKGLQRNHEEKSTSLPEGHMTRRKGGGKWGC